MRKQQKALEWLDKHYKMVIDFHKDDSNFKKNADFTKHGLAVIIDIYEDAIRGAMEILR